MAFDPEQGEAGNPEGVSRNDPTLPLFFNPAFAQVFEGRGDEPLQRAGTETPAAAQGSTPPPAAPAPQFAVPPDDDEGVEPTQAVPFPQFPGRQDPSSQMAGDETGAESVAAAQGSEPGPPSSDATLLGQIQAQQASVAAILQSTERALAALAERVGQVPAAPPAPAAPVAPHPAVVRMCERLGVEPDEFVAAIGAVSGGQLENFARALDENIRSAEQAQREFIDTMKAADPSFDKATFDAFLMADANAARTMQTAVDKTATGAIVWEYAKMKMGAAVPAAPVQQVAGDVAPAAAPVKGARAAAAPGAKGTKVPQLTDAEQRVQKLAKLEEKTRDLGDEHPLSRNYFMTRLFGSADMRDFVDPRVARHGRLPRPRPQA